MKRKVTGGILLTIGYLLSPFSWWNDIVINIPLAYGFGFLFSLLSKELFFPMMIVGYWITNSIGFLLIHLGIKNIVIAKKAGNSNKQVVHYILISIVYTLVVMGLMKLHWLPFPY